MTRQEQKEINQLARDQFESHRELKQMVEDIGKKNHSFRLEIREDIKNIFVKLDSQDKVLEQIKKDYIPTKWIQNGWKVMAYLIGVGLTIWGIIIYGYKR